MSERYDQAMTTEPNAAREAMTRRQRWVMKPRDGRERLAFGAMILAIGAWMPLAEPLGKWAATMGMVATVVVCAPAYARWRGARAIRLRARKAS